MKKTTIISALCLLATITLSVLLSPIGLGVGAKVQDAKEATTSTTLPYPDTVTPEIKKNKELLIEKFGYDEITAEKIAKRLYTVGVKEIKTIRVDVHEEGDEELGFGGSWLYFITDSAGNTFYVTTDGFGGYLEVQKDGRDGEYLYMRPIFVHIDEPPLKWWQKQPNWIQWLLRYICFGWAWMK